MQSIITKYLPATNTRAARIKAQASGWGDGRSIPAMTFSYDYALEAEDNHRRAAHALADKLKWSGTWHEGGHGSRGNVYVCAKGRSFTVPEEYTMRDKLREQMQNGEQP